MNLAFVPTTPYIDGMRKTPSLGVRVQPDLKAALKRAARTDMRTVSSLVEKILTEWLQANGYLKPDRKV